MKFTEAQHDALRDGEWIERTFPAKRGDVAPFEKCPLSIGQVVSAVREGKRRGAFDVEVIDIWLVDAPGGGKDWNVLLGRDITPGDLRLLKHKSGYTDDPDRAMGAGQGPESDPGEAVPESDDADQQIAAKWKRRELALAYMRNAWGDDPAMMRQLRAIERQAEQAIAEAA